MNELLAEWKDRVIGVWKLVDKPAEIRPADIVWIGLLPKRTDWVLKKRSDYKASVAVKMILDKREQRGIERRLSCLDLCLK